MTLDEVMELAGREQYLAVVSTLRADSTIQASLVNAGVLDHPLTVSPRWRSSPTARPSCATSAPDHRWPSRSGPRGPGRRSKEQPN